MVGRMQHSAGPEYLGLFCVWGAAWFQILMTLKWLCLSGNVEVSFRRAVREACSVAWILH
jgi:hypothetical protein